MDKIPQHVAFIMDGNGRWAKKRFLPRVAGHVKGVSALKKIVDHCDAIGIKNVTVFAFGRENWNRPQSEVSFLMKLMLKKLNKELGELNSKKAQIHFIGDRTRINHEFAKCIEHAEQLTANNTGIIFNICVDYSGECDIIQAVNRIIQDKLELPVTEQIFAKYLLTSHSPNPELVIRTSGESRISNFMLWQLAYSEIYFCQTLWPDFTPIELNKALEWYNNRERRFGKISEQL